MRSYDRSGSHRRIRSPCNPCCTRMLRRHANGDGGRSCSIILRAQELKKRIGVARPDSAVGGALRASRVCYSEGLRRRVQHVEWIQARSPHSTPWSPGETIGHKTAITSLDAHAAAPPRAPRLSLTSKRIQCHGSVGTSSGARLIRAFKSIWATEIELRRQFGKRVVC